MKNRNLLAKFMTLFFILVICNSIFCQNKPEEKKQPDSYIIGPKDLLSVTVFGASELNTRARISEDGEITLPLVGRIKLEGLSRIEAEKNIEEFLDTKYLKNARVSIYIEEYRSKTVSVIGAVANSGDQELIGQKTLLQIISKAGGFLEFAAGKIIIFREIKGQKTTKVVDINELITQGNISLNIKILPGDIINIPRAQFLNVYVFGQVRTPGNHRIRVNIKGATLLKAIAQAGGFTERARRKGVMITRSTNMGPKRIKVNIKKIIAGKKKDIILKQDDIIFIPESFF